MDELVTQLHHTGRRLLLEHPQYKVTVRGQGEGR
jgi:hypothetical protein